MPLFGAGGIRAANRSFQSFSDQELNVLFQALKEKQRRVYKHLYFLDAKDTMMHQDND
jgi:hypothetical protein